MDQTGHDQSKHYTGIQYSATGVFGYLFVEGNEERFRVSSFVVLDPDIGLSGFGRELWHRKYDGQLTLVPGARRDVVDEDGTVQGYYTYTALDGFDIVAGNSTVSVKAAANGWSVYSGLSRVAEILRVTEAESAQFEENGYDMQIRFQVSISEGADQSLYPYILAIPMLGF